MNQEKLRLHKEFCPIYLSSVGRWRSTNSPYCNCDSFTQSDGSSPLTLPEQEPKKLKKIFQCRRCYGLFIVPVNFNKDQLQCEHDKFSTGAIKDLYD